MDYQICDSCGEIHELYYNEATGLALCFECDADADAEEILGANPPLILSNIVIGYGTAPSLSTSTNTLTR